ncbi:hypothetical protein MRB53_016662 [Persea americana]|uniref:Uncharacterized protein n=1 Tax=Persea americana TaxID=3435 RepID=A0ACC2M2T6_PERAE|nr:hypothetical protein MRB53_016662 [Persea americana]
MNNCFYSRLHKCELGEAEEEDAPLLLSREKAKRRSAEEAQKIVKFREAVRRAMAMRERQVSVSDSASGTQVSSRIRSEGDKGRQSSVGGKDAVWAAGPLGKGLWGRGL